MDKITIVRFPKSADTEVLMKQSRPMRIARLKSLQSDPTHFYSKFENESNQDTEFWLNRLRPGHVQHFVAVCSEKPIEKPDDLVLDAATEFKGFAVVVNEYEAELAERAKEGEVAYESSTRDLPTYFLGAMWVDTSVRGQGIGSRIIQESIAWIKEDARTKGWPKVRYRTTALHGNDRAANLYRSLGFDIDQDDRYRESEQDLATHLSMIL